MDFAAERRQEQDELAQRLLPSIEVALQEDDWDPVLQQVKLAYAQMLDRHQVAAADEDDLSSLVETFQASLTKSTSDSNAEAIALMLAVGTINAATAQSAKQGGQQLEWVTMRDNDVREAHEEVDGQRREVGQTFTVGGFEMPFPGWPGVPVELWINCRCSLRPTDSRAFSPESDDVRQTGAELTQSGDDMDEEVEVEEINRSDASPVPWFGVLVPEGVRSGDGRMFKEGALRTRDLPLPLTWQKVSAEGHNQNVTVAKIEKIVRVGNEIRGMGHFLMTPEADEAIGLTADFGRYGVSIDADDIDQESVSIELAEDGRESVTFSDGRICSACMVSIPAFQEAFVSLGEAPEGFFGAEEDEEVEESFRDVSQDERDRRADDGTAMDDGSYPIANCSDLKNAIQAIGRAKDPAATKAHIRKRASALDCPDVDLPEEWAVEDVEEASIEEAKRGPGWVTHPKETRRIHAYWTKPGQPGYAKIAWGEPGDFNRCRTLVGEKIAANSPEDTRFLNQICAQWHHDALGIWPGEHKAAVNAIDAVGESLTAGGGWAAPSEWFKRPDEIKSGINLSDDDRRVFGYVAEWGVCHITYPGACVEAPASLTDYAFFATGEILTEDGERVAVGALTIDTGHAPGHLKARPAAAHYDNTGSVWAYVAIGEDERGIWYSGIVKPGTSEDTINTARASGRVSGDWREMNGNLELVAALTVNVPGFPIQPVEAMVASGQQISLVAAGVSEPKSGKVEVNIRLGDDDVARIAAAVRNEERAELKRAERMAALKEKIGADNV